MSFEEQYLDVLQNIEFIIADLHRDKGDVSDYNVMRALDALIGVYRAESRGHTQKPVKLEGRDLDLFIGVKTICEWRMGRTQPQGSPEEPPEESNSLDEILACLKRVRKSVDYWHKQGGSDGYLRYVSEFV